MNVDMMTRGSQSIPRRLPLRVSDKKVIGTVAAHHQYANFCCRQHPRDLGGNPDRAQWNIRVNAKTSPVIPGMASCVRNRDQDRMVTFERAGECAIHHHGTQGLKVLTANKSIRRYMLLESQSATRIVYGNSCTDLDFIGHPSVTQAATLSSSGGLRRLSDRLR